MFYIAYIRTGVANANSNGNNSDCNSGTNNNMFTNIGDVTKNNKQNANAPTKIDNSTEKKGENTKHSDNVVCDFLFSLCVFFS